MQAQIEERLNQLRQQRTMLVANLNATDGAIAILEDLLRPQPEPDEQAPAASPSDAPPGAPAPSGKPPATPS